MEQIKTRYVQVEVIQMHRHTYFVEVPEDSPELGVEAVLTGKIDGKKKDKYANNLVDEVVTSSKPISPKGVYNALKRGIHNSVVKLTRRKNGTPRFVLFGSA